MSADQAALPRHVAIIMDGNGRWARARGWSRIEGHRQGAEAVRKTVRAARELGISMLTLFALSEQNWNRPSEEIAALMQLLLDYLQQERSEILDNGIRLTAIGDVTRLPTQVRTVLHELCQVSATNRGMTLCLALSYGGREDLTQAAQRLAQDVATGRTKPQEVNAEVWEQYLYTHKLGDVDLLIRTSGEQRISNFMLWSTAYAELWFTDKLWPDFSRIDLEQAIADYQHRQRRFGLTAEQVE